jgi:hypothetical protein
MEIITTIFSYFWVEILFTLYGIALIYLSRMRFYPYAPHDIYDNVPEDFETYFQLSEQAFYDLNWIRLGTFHCTHPKEENVIVSRFFCSADYNHAAMLAQCTATDGHVIYITEFCSELFPSGYILTNSNPYPASMAYPNSKIVFRFPSVNDVNILHRHHLEFCEVAQSESFMLKKLKPECLQGYIYQAYIRDFEYQVKKGRMKKIEDNVYSWTLIGTILAVPMQAIYFLHSFLFSFKRPNKEKMIKRLKKKLAKVQQDQLFVNV